MLGVVLGNARHVYARGRRCFLAGSLMVAALGCSQPNPAAPAPLRLAPGNYEGTWVASFKIQQCNGYRQCFALIGTKDSVFLRLRQIGSQVVGVMRVESYVLTTDVSGLIAADGSLTLTGIRRGTSGTELSWDDEIECRLTLDTQFLSGTLTITTRNAPPEILSTSTRVRSGMIESGVPVPPNDLGTGSFAGRWRGAYDVRNCSAVGWTYCQPTPGTVRPLELALEQSGTSVTGTGSDWGPLALAGALLFQLSGTASGGLLILQAVRTDPKQSGVDRGTTTFKLTATRDDFGRLTGSLVVIQEIVWSPGGMQGGGTWSETSDSELINMLLEPAAYQ
jgi:hypothetical protein